MPSGSAPRRCELVCGNRSADLGLGGGVGRTVVGGAPGQMGTAGGGYGHCLHHTGCLGKVLHTVSFC